MRREERVVDGHGGRAHSTPLRGRRRRPGADGVDRARRRPRAGRARPRAPSARRPAGAPTSPKCASSALRAARPDAGQRVEQRRGLPRGPARAVAAQREAVRLVADLLQQQQPRRLARQQDGLRAPGTNTSSSRLASETTATRGRSKAAHRVERRAQLALAAVDHDQVRQRREAAVVAVVVDAPVPLEAPRARPRRSSGSRPGPAVADAEAPVVGPLRPPVLEHDHRGHRVRVLQVRDVEALDADRQRLEVERLAQLLERPDAARARALARSTSWRTPELRRCGCASSTSGACRRARARAARPAAPRRSHRKPAIRSASCDLGVDADERRDADLRVVVLEQEAREQRRPRPRPRRSRGSASGAPRCAPPRTASSCTLARSSSTASATAS